LHNLYTIKTFFKITYIVPALLLIALAAVAIYYYSSHEKPLKQTDRKLLRDYAFVSDPDSLKKALRGMNTSTPSFS
jgi:hypothetical protein